MVKILGTASKTTSNRQKIITCSGIFRGVYMMIGWVYLFFQRIPWEFLEDLQASPFHPETFWGLSPWRGWSVLGQVDMNKIDEQDLPASFFMSQSHTDPPKRESQLEVFKAHPFFCLLFLGAEKNSRPSWHCFQVHALHRGFKPPKRQRFFDFPRRGLETALQGQHRLDTLQVLRCLVDSFRHGLMDFFLGDLS